MEVHHLTIGKVFSSGGDIHYILPHFQREYTWGKPEWHTLMTDALAVYDEYQEESPPEHFLGSLVVIDGGKLSGVTTVHLLVDGQQRLTSISLVLCALRDLIRPTLPLLADKIQAMVVNKDEEGAGHLKLLPTTKYDDRTTYRAIALGAPPAESASSILGAYRYFSHEINRRIQARELDPTRMYRVLITCFQVVFIELKAHESPYRIFESLNAKGKPLAQADLVRNYIAMKLPAKHQEAVFRDEWEPIDNWLHEKGEVGRLGELSAFIRHYLAMQSGALSNENHIYARFRDRMETEFNTTDAFIAELSDLRRFASYYDKLLRPEHERNTVIRERLLRLRTLEVATAYPFLLAMYDALDEGALSESDFVQGLAILENYLVRRYLCGEQTNYTNSMFPILWRDTSMRLADFAFPEALRAVLATKNCPTDRKVREAVHSRAIYKTGTERLSLILHQVNDQLTQGFGVKVTLDEAPTIEHILPQTLSPAWQAELGEQAMQIQADYLHTLGNLTLVTQEWNSQLSNSSFATKQAKLASHGMRLNSVYFSQSNAVWDAAAIVARADFLAEHILAIWPSFGEGIAQEPVKRKAGGSWFITIRNETFAIKRLRDAIFQILEYSVRHGKFAEAQEVASKYLRQAEPQGREVRHWRLLANGWYVNINSNYVTDWSKRVLRQIGVADEEWRIFEEVREPAAVVQ